MGRYSITYLFSAWPDLRKHIDTSLPRPLMYVAPLAWLTIAAVIGLTLRRASGNSSPLDACA